MFFLTGMSYAIPKLFTDDPAVINLIISLVLVLATFQLFDVVTTNRNGILNFMERQKVSG